MIKHISCEVIKATEIWIHFDTKVAQKFLQIVEKAKLSYDILKVDKGPFKNGVIVTVRGEGKPQLVEWLSSLGQVVNTYSVTATCLDEDSLPKYFDNSKEFDIVACITHEGDRQ